jgi:hypothetical protein
VNIPFVFPGHKRAGYVSAALGITLVEWKALTSFEWLSLVVSIVGFAAVVVTLYLLHVENRLSERALKEGALVPLKLQQLEIDKIFIEKPHLRKYFYEDCPVLDPNSEETAQALAMAEYILDHFAAILPHTTVKGERLTFTIWRNYMRDSFAQSRVLSDTLRTRRQWYPDELFIIQREGEDLKKGEDGRIDSRT